MNIRNILHTSAVILFLGLTACGGDGYDDDPVYIQGIAPLSGSGTEIDPYVITLGTWYSTSIPSFSLLAGSDIWFQFDTTVTGYYIARVQNPYTDLALDLFDTGKSFVATCDQYFAGVTEVCNTIDIPPSGYSLTGSSTYYIGIFNWTDATENAFALKVDPV